jgi:hypothetical protein
MRKVSRGRLDFLVSTENGDCRGSIPFNCPTRGGGDDLDVGDGDVRGGHFA